MRFEALEAFKQWLPVLVGRVMGNRGDGAGAKHAFTEGLLGSLTEEQVMKLFESGILTQAQGALLVSIVQHLAAERAQQQAGGAQNGRPINEEHNGAAPPADGGTS